jgi:hypothetical protein
VRCPSCDAAVPADAAWCTLCFARLQPASASEPVPAPPAATVTSAPGPVLAAADPLTDPLVPAPVAPAPVVPAPVTPVATATAVMEPLVAPTWPCTGCEARVPLEEMTCPSCGTGFMGGVSPTVSLHVPGVGDLASMSPGGRFGVMAAGAAVVTVLLFLVALVLGHLF